MQYLEILALLDKAWHRSKKFIAFLIMELFLFALAAYILFITRALDWSQASVLIAIVFSMSSLSLAFNSTQAKQDLYTRGMALLGGNLPEKLREQFIKDVGLTKKEASPDKEETS